MHHRELTEGERVRERRPPEPAPLPLHALLELQRSAGNQAVGRVLARKPLYKRGEVRRHVAQAVEGGAATVETILLAIHNELSRSLGDAPAGYTDVATAEAALIKAGQMNAEDPPIFLAEATAQLPAQPLPAAATGRGKPTREKKEKKPKGPTKEEAEAALKERIAADRPAIVAGFEEHVIVGAFRKDHRPSGFHMEGSGSTTHRAFGETEKAGDTWGTYQKSVVDRDDPQNIKPYKSTFFPESASKNDILDAITSVYGASAKGQKTVAYPDKLRGMPLIKHDSSDEKTVFPDTMDPAEGEGFSKAYKPKPKKR
jgi:hypothetical protein